MNKLERSLTVLLVCLWHLTCYRLAGTSDIKQKVWKSGTIFHIKGMCCACFLYTLCSRFPWSKSKISPGNILQAFLTFCIIILKIYLKGRDQILTTMYQFPFPTTIFRFINHFDKSIHYYSYLSSQLFLK